MSGPGGGSSGGRQPPPDPGPAGMRSLSVSLGTVRVGTICAGSDFIYPKNSGAAGDLDLIYPKSSGAIYLRNLIRKGHVFQKIFPLRGQFFH